MTQYSFPTPPTAIRETEPEGQYFQWENADRILTIYPKLKRAYGLQRAKSSLDKWDDFEPTDSALIAEKFAWFEHG